MIGSKAISSSGTIDEANTTGIELEADEKFVGGATELTNYSIFFVTVFSDVASATNGLQIEMSPDGTTWRVGEGDFFTIPAGKQKSFSFQASSRFMRVSYTNGAADQTEFDLQTMLKRSGTKASSHRIQDAIIDEDDAELIKAVITAKNSDGEFINLTATKSGNLKIASIEDGLSIARGIVSNTTYVHKFGNAPDFDTSDNFVTIWDGANDAGINQMRYVYSTTADIDSVVSTSAADTFAVRVQGLDSDWNLVTQEVTLSGQTRVALTTNLIRVFRIRNLGSVDNAGSVFVYVNTAIVAGLPTDKTKIRSKILAGNNQTLMAVYTIPNGKTGYMRDWYGSTAGSSKDSNYVIELRAREQGGAFQLKHVSSVSDNGTSYVHHKYEEPEKFSAKVDLEMRVKMTATGGSAAAFSAGFDIVLIDD